MIGSFIVDSHAAGLSGVLADSRKLLPSGWPLHHCLVAKGKRSCYDSKWRRQRGEGPDRDSRRRKEIEKGEVENRQREAQTERQTERDSERVYV